MNTRISQAATLHRHAAAIGVAAAAALKSAAPAPQDLPEQHELAQRLRAAAALLAPGWLGAPLDAQFPDTPLGGAHLPRVVRVGTAQPLDDARFPALVPLLGTGHLTIDADCRDPRVAGLIRAVLLRLLAAAPAGSLLVRGVATTAASPVFTPFAPLADAGLMPPPVTDQAGLRAVLAEAERWVRPVRRGTTRRNRHERTLLLVIAGLPELAGTADLHRISALARYGPEAGLHLIAAGWPPPPLTVESTQPPLPRATMITLRNPYALLGDPPGGSFADPAHGLPATGLNAPVFLDENPPTRLLDRVCRELAARLRIRPRHTLADLLPAATDGLWTESAAAGLRTPIGHDGDTPVTLRFNELTPHWLVSGRPGAGKTSFLVNVIHGLCARYGPQEFTLRAITFAAERRLADLLILDPDGGRLPHLPPVGGEGSGPEHALVVLRELAEELDRRASACRSAGVTRVSELPDGVNVPRILCIIDDLQALPDQADPADAEATRLIELLARGGRNHRIHLLLAGDPVVAAPTETRLASDAGWKAIHNQIPVRVALPGGAPVLEPSNDSAAGLPRGAAVINTAGGLGGPRGATRGHERVINFPDPHADPDPLRRFRHRLRDTSERAAR